MATVAITPDQDTITGEIFIAAPPARVFQAITDPNQMPRWWGAQGLYRINDWKADVRVGGKWSSEGVGVDGYLHPLQRAFADGFAAQCGFCTSGMILAVKALLDRNPDPDRRAVIDAISGNICRCTGYEPIIAAVLAAAAEMRPARSA